MTQRQTQRPQLLLQLGTEDAALDARAAGVTVDLQHSVQVAQVEADRARIAVAHVRLDAARHAGPAAIGHHRGAGGRAPLQDGAHLGLGARKGHQVRRVLPAPGQAAGQVVEGLAQRVLGAVPGLLTADVGQRAGRLQPRLP